MKFVFVVLALVALAFGQDGGKMVVDTHYGKVQGDTGLSRDGRMFHQFKGIPYGKVPERFQVSEIPDNWEGVKDATKFGENCVHYDPNTEKYLGSEDCLTLSIYSPKLPKDGESKVLLPVVVLLHPGGNDHDSGDMFGPKYMMDSDIIMVSINSRLGPFGYLNLGDKHAQGNMGLKDQSLALRFVQSNIENFGGDKGRVTLMGFSSGASSVVLHLLSPLSKGLFHGISVHSGGPFSPTSLVRNPIKNAKLLGEQVSCPVDTKENLVKCLKGMDPLELLKKMKKAHTRDVDQLFQEDIPFFGPSIEKVLEGQTENDVALVDIPYKLLNDGKIFNKVPAILGITDKDGYCAATAILLNSTKGLSKLDEKWADHAPLLLSFKQTSDNPKEVAEKIKDFYFPGEKKLDDDTLINILTDRYYAVATRFLAKQYTKYAPVYPFIFTHVPNPSSLWQGFGLPKKIKGAGHGEDLPYFFNVTSIVNLQDITKENSLPEELTLSKGMVKLWASFFENGKPTKTWGEGKEWKKLENPDKPAAYQIDVETRMIEEKEDIVKRMNFWGELLRKDLSKESLTPEEEKF